MTTANENERKLMGVVAQEVEASQPGHWTGADVNLYHEMWPDLTLLHMRIMGRVCLERGLNPAVGDIFPVVYGKGTSKAKLVLIESLDSMRKRGHSTGRVAAMKGPEFCGPDKIWTDVWLDDDPPVAARYGMRAHGMAEMTWHVRLWKEVTKLGEKGDDFWRPASKGGMPVNQLGNAAERHAWRRTVPHIFTNMNAPEEMAAGPGVSVHALPKGVAPELLAGDIVADEDGVIVSGQDETPADMAKVLTSLWRLMSAADPAYLWPELELLPGWPPGADRPEGVKALLDGAAGTEEELAAMVFLDLEQQRTTD